MTSTSTSYPPPSVSRPPTNGSGGHVDAAVLLLVEEVRRSNDSMRAEMVGAIKDLTGEVQELRKQAPGRLAFYALSAIVLIAMVALLALVATRGVDPTTVAHAAVEASSPR